MGRHTNDKMFFGFISLIIASLIVLLYADDSNVVIDLKFLNHEINLVKVRDSGVKGIIHMITLGVDFKDPTYEARKKQAEGLGLLWGAYHISNGSPGEDQAKYFLEAVGNDTGILLAIGIEKSNSSMKLKDAEEFVTQVYKERGRYPLVYGHEYLAELVKYNQHSVLTKCPLWIFQYQENIVVPKGWLTWTLWQYTNGIKGPKPHDVNGVGPCGRDKINIQLYKDIGHLWELY